ncbi:Alpha/Beta hydrolase protein [Mycena leptocephala]|nr:Alpha/Beta hydrolase protein [Mycena leptocephala]
MTETPTPPLDGTFELALRQRHLQQLRNVDIPGPEGRIPGPPWPVLPGAPSPYNQLVQWSKQASKQIKRAVEQQATSGSNIDWDIMVFTLLESAAVYLRDTEKVFQAVIEARKRTDEGDKHALQLLKDSQADIKKIAALWGLNFEVICDLLKGTNVRDWKEIFVDLKFAMMMVPGSILWGSPIHTGFYQTMFIKFPDIGLAPLDYIKHMIDNFLQSYNVSPGIAINLHVTGHSLGGAYATLCYAELMRLYNNTPAKGDLHGDLAHFFSQLKEKRQFFLRDLNTFGCPRLGGLWNKVDWAKHYKTALDDHKGQTWRLVNKDDPVTSVPPVIPLISTWNHVDHGYEVSDNNAPTPVPSEIGTQPSVSIKPWNFPYHSTGKYFQNLYNASITGTNIANIAVEWVEEIPDVATWAEMETEAQALLSPE